MAREGRGRRAVVCGQLLTRLSIPDGEIRNDVRYEVMTRNYEFAHDLWAWEGMTHRTDLVVPWEMTFAVQFWSPSAYTFVPVVDGALREDRAVTVQPGEFARVVLPEGTGAIEVRGADKTAEVRDRRGRNCRAVLVALGLHLRARG